MPTLQKKPLIKLTPARRGELARILAGHDSSMSVGTKAVVLGREMACKPSHSEALSLLGQLQRPVRKGKSWAQINEERFQRQSARRPDLYR